MSKPHPVTSLIVNRRTSWLLALLIMLAAGAVIGLLGEADYERGPTDKLAIGADSTKVVELQQQLPKQQGSTAVVVYSADSGELSAEAVTAIKNNRLLQVIAPVVISEDKTAAIGIVPIAGNDNSSISTAVKELREAVKADAPQGVTVLVTGPAAIQTDLGAVFDGANLRLLIATATVVAVLLLVTYRSPTLWLLPLIVVGVADRLAAVLATHVMKLFGVSWDESTVGILSVLVFGAGTDYALLLISRYRDELRTHEDRFEAMRVALARTAEAVLLSSSTVVLAVLTLLLSALPTTRGLGLASAVGIVVAAFFALVVLPAFVVLFGRWIFWPVTPKVGDTPLVDQRPFWRKVGDVVAKRPPLFVAATLLLLFGLSAGALQIKSGLSETDQFLQKPEAIAGAERLAKSFPAGSSDPVLVITDGDAQAVATKAKSVPAVAEATPGAKQGNLTELRVVLKTEPGSDESAQAIRDLRTALDGTGQTYVGGTEAKALDEADAASHDRKIIFPLIVGLVLVALGLLLRAVVAPLILVATVLLTFVASLGAAWWIFTGIFGFSGLDVGAPLITFLFSVALGVDYNIFLVTRAREEAVRFGTREGMLRALGATGGVITSAGILLAGVFAVLGILPLVVLAQIGVIICIGVLLDTLIVRTVLVPAIALILGDKFWWPRKIQPVAVPERGLPESEEPTLDSAPEAPRRAVETPEQIAELTEQSND